MKQIKLKSIDEVIYYKKLDNGMDVYLYPTKKINNNFVTFTTRFGSINNEFTPINKTKTIKTPHGIAHFLEHKVFEQEQDPQPSSFFSNSGALSNAYTSFKNTTYLFSGPDNLEENITYLLDFVQSPYFTDENVESEKGIIDQEINMCNDRPFDILYEHIRTSTLHTNNYKDSIIGTSKEINSITKELLQTCYDTFYHPSNMFLVVTGNFDKDDILNAIISNQQKKEFLESNNIKTPKIKEKDTVVKEKDIVAVNTNISKIAYNIKIPTNLFNINKRKLNLYMYIIFGIMFDDASILDEQLKKENIITDSISINVLNCDTHIIISLINETNNYELLLKKIKNTLKNINITKEDLERKKRVLISNEIFTFENIEIINDLIVDNIIFENKIEKDPIGVINSLNIKQLNEIVSKIDINNSSTVILSNKNI